MKIRDLYSVVFGQTLTVVCIGSDDRLITLLDSVSVFEAYNDFRDCVVSSVSSLGKGQLLILVD